MARYIDIDTAIENIRNGAGTAEQKLFAECCLLCVPTADVAPKSEVASEIFEELEKLLITDDFEKYYGYPVVSYDKFGYAILKEKYKDDERRKDNG